MRLEVFCEDRLGLTRELLEILAKRSIDLRGIEIDVSGIIYLNCPDIDFDTFSELMTEIRRINGVKDVRKIQFMPMERQNHELLAVLDSLPSPVLSVDLKGNIDTANHAANSLFGAESESLNGRNISQALPSFSFQDWLDGQRSRVRENVVHNGLDYILELMPVFISGDDRDQALVSAVIALRPVAEVSHNTDVLTPSQELGFEHFVGISNRHKSLISQAKKLAMLDQPLLIEGETGTGKEMLARACHNRSHRSAEPFMVLSCASMPDDVAETELFGNAPGSFNDDIGHKGIFEQADGGTVFLDEIGEMSPHLQIKLLRLMQDGTFRRVGEEQEMHVDVRVIASTRHNLAELAESGSFREDLFYRLNVLTLTIPPLRERASDIGPLLELFVAKHAHNMNMTIPKWSSELTSQLATHHWPGNMRQLDNTVLRALTELEGNELVVDYFHLPSNEKLPTSFNSHQLDGSLDDIMKSYEAQILEHLFQSYPSSRKLAKRLDVSHTSIANKLRDYSIRKQ
ncbi:transcriptional regulator TyrR [Vibrio sp. WXL103]|uniref:transcriptional regulator TyrR n=1 Tax=unclassified Vibrio TaxID=2614977 RepID=UPI003EC5ED62